MSFSSTACSIKIVPLVSTTRTAPFAVIGMFCHVRYTLLLFCAIKPTFGTLPIVVGQSAMFFAKFNGSLVNSE
jgi:hypothetical protein